MSKTKPTRVQLTDRFFLEGTPFDWRLIRKEKGKNNEGKIVDSERCLYFPRLHQIAQHIVDSDAKEAKTLDELILVIQTSTNAIVKRLGSMDLDRKADLDLFADVIGELKTKVDDNGEQERTDTSAAKTAKSGPKPKRTRTRKVAAKAEAEPEPEQPRRRRRRKAAG